MTAEQLPAGVDAADAPDLQEPAPGGQVLEGRAEVDLPVGDPWSAALLCAIAEVYPPTTVEVALSPPVVAMLLAALTEVQHAQYAALGVPHPSARGDVDDDQEEDEDGVRRPLRQRLGDPLDIRSTATRVSPQLLIAALVALTVLVLLARWVL